MHYRHVAYLLAVLTTTESCIMYATVIAYRCIGQLRKLYCSSIFGKLLDNSDVIMSKINYKVISTD